MWRQYRQLNTSVGIVIARGKRKTGQSLEGKEEISNFISRLGHLAGNQEAGFHSVCVCLPLTVGMRTSH